MEALVVSPYVLAALFFVVAFLYSSVGLGGGSSYTALLAIFGANPVAIPSVSLTLNALVTSIGSFNFIRGGHARLNLIGPFLIGSIPMAFVGGMIALPARWFYVLLLASLIIVALRIYAPGETALRVRMLPAQKLLASLLIGGGLGFLAGAVGIGGGIYLVPLVILLGLGNAKEAAACGAVFIWVNSVTGIAARVVAERYEPELLLPIAVAVIAGAILGSRIGAGKASPRKMEKVLGLVIIVAVILLARKTWLLF